MRCCVGSRCGERAHRVELRVHTEVKRGFCAVGQPEMRRKRLLCIVRLACVPSHVDLIRVQVDGNLPLFRIIIASLRLQPSLPNFARISTCGRDDGASEIDLILRIIVIEPAEAGPGSVAGCDCTTKRRREARAPAVGVELIGEQVPNLQLFWVLCNALGLEFLLVSLVKCAANWDSRYVYLRKTKDIKARLLSQRG